MAEILLELRDVSVSFKGIKAINSLSFSVARGEICALIGPNGAGKSSLLNIINGIYQADDGDVMFAGERYKYINPLHAARLGIGRTFQHNALFKGLSVMDNVLAGLTRHRRASLFENAFGIGREPTERRDFNRRADRMIEFLGLTPHRNTIVSRLSYGVQKRVDIARALVTDPTLLLLDEPMAGMNADEKQNLADLIHAANRDLGITIVLIEHDIGVVMGLSHHVVVLDYGRKVGDGSPDTVRNDPAVIAAYLGTPHREIAA
jgi:branched-chain amino acid transport system ATP-binding protein